MKHFLELLILVLFLLPSLGVAEVKEIISEGTYNMGDGETPAVAESRALLQAKRIAVEQTGTYLESYSKVKNFQLTDDEIPVFASGVMKAIILVKKQTLIEEDFSNAIYLDPELAFAYFNRGLDNIIEGQYDWAIEDLTKAIHLNPNYAVAYHERGLAYYFLGKYQQALNDSNKVIEMNPKDINEYSFRGLIYARLGDYQKATNDLNKAISMDSDNMGVYYTMGCFYSIQNKPDQACFYLKKVIEKGYKDWESIKKDIDLDNIRNHECYRQIMKGK